MIKIKVLIVEDDPISANLLKIFLKKRDFIIDLAENGEIATRLIIEAKNAGENYKLIFLDIMMPVKDGKKLLEEIRECEKKHKIPKKEMIKIIMTTALDGFDTVYESFKNQCDGYLVKPFFKEKLDEILDLVL